MKMKSVQCMKKNVESATQLVKRKLVTQIEVFLVGMK
jgi:hypothetical protein